MEARAWVEPAASLLTHIQTSDGRFLARASHSTTQPPPRSPHGSTCFTELSDSHRKEILLLPLLTEKGGKAHRGKATCPRSHSSP